MAFDPVVNRQIGLRLRELRETQGLTREQMAERADISVQFLADIETGRKGMTVQTLRKLVLVLHCSSDQLLFGVSQRQDAAAAALAARVLELTPQQARLANQVLDLVLAARPGEPAPPFQP